MPPLVLTQTQTFKTSQATARIAPTISQDVPPIHAGEEGRALDRMRDRQAERVQEKPAKFVFGHLAGGHRKLAVFLRALAAHMALHPDVVGRVGEDGGGLLSGEQRVIGLRFQRVPAEETVAPKRPKIARRDIAGPSAT